MKRTTAEHQSNAIAIRRTAEREKDPAHRERLEQHAKHADILATLAARLDRHLTN